MKFNIPKEWCLKMAELEGDSEISAGSGVVIGETVISSDAAAITWDPKNGFQLLLPNHSGNDIVAEEIRLLSAIWNGICTEDNRIASLYDDLVQEMKDA